jgi:BirA family biotin operon repressor/biotin-[acetyl-CoA-carboxylase] ligase
VPHELTQRVALAAAAASHELAGLRPELKWPNDLLLDGRKLAGILAQAGDVTAAGVGFVVVGMGLNLGWAPVGAARLEGVTRDDFFAAWLAHLADRWTEPVHGPYRDALATIGRRVRVQQPNEELVGDAIDVTAAGELVVDVDGRRVVVAVGDVVHLRLAD